MAAFVGVEEDPLIVGAENRVGMAVLCLPRATMLTQTAHYNPTIYVGHERHVAVTVFVARSQIAAVAYNQAVI